MENADIRTRLDAVIDRIGNVVCLLFLVGMAISVYEVISRYIFDSPTLWVHESTIMLVALSFAFGGSYSVARNSHISIKLLYDHVSPRQRQLLDILNAFLAFIFTLAIAYAAYDMVEKSLFTPQGEFRLETSGSAWNPPIPPLVKSGLLIALGLMALQNFLHIIKAIRTGPIAPHGPQNDIGAA